MNVLLIKPFYPYPYTKGEHTYNRIWFPLALANCAGLLEEKGHKVKVVDAHAQRIKPSRIKAYAKGFDKIFITSSSLDKWQCPNIDLSYFLDTLGYLKEISDEVYVMGCHGTMEPEKMLSVTGAKAVIIGEPEYTVFEICQNGYLPQIKGVVFKDNLNVSFTPPREPLDLRKISTPAFHLFDFRRYFYEILGRRFALFEISRGCKFRCRFCNKIMYGENLRVKSKEQVFREITLAVEKYNVKTGYFIDLDFFSNGKVVEELCEYLIEKNYRFKWTCQTRPDSLDIKTLKKWKKAGCQLIHLGVETGSRKLLSDFNKEMDLDKVKEVVKLCRVIGIKTLAFFLFGLPGETQQERDESFNFAKELNTDFISFHKVFPYQGSDIHQDNVRSNREIDKFIRSAFIGYYLRLSCLRRMDLGVFLRGLRLFFARLTTL